MVNASNWILRIQEIYFSLLLGKIVYLLNKEYSIGRKNCAIELPDDLTVSRQHLKLLVDYSALTLVSL